MDLAMSLYMCAVLSFVRAEATLQKWQVFMGKPFVSGEVTLPLALKFTLTAAQVFYITVL